MDHLPRDRANGGRRPVARRLSGAALVTAIVVTAVGTGALAFAANPLHLGSAVASRPGSAADVRMKMRIPRPGWAPAGTVILLRGPVVASTGPSPARVEAHGAKVRDSGGLARDIAYHMAAGNTEVARYVIPFEARKATGCKVAFLTATVDPARKKAVRAEKKARGSRITGARGAVGHEAVAHASESTVEGLELHVIVVQTCPDRRGT